MRNLVIMLWQLKSNFRVEPIDESHAQYHCFTVPHAVALSSWLFSSIFGDKSRGKFTRSRVGGRSAKSTILNVFTNRWATQSCLSFWKSYISLENEEVSSKINTPCVCGDQQWTIGTQCQTISKTTEETHPTRLRINLRKAECWRRRNT